MFARGVVVSFSLALTLSDNMSNCSHCWQGLPASEPFELTSMKHHRGNYSHLSYSYVNYHYLITIIDHKIFSKRCTEGWESMPYESF